MFDCEEERLLRRIKSEDYKVKLNILLCDDDVIFLQKLADTVSSQPLPLGLSTHIVKVSDSTKITDSQLAQFQIMFLDIDMGERSGMDVAHRVRELHLESIIIFVTNYPQFSIEGYEVRAYRYLLKQELEQKLPIYFHSALSEIPNGDNSLHFSVNSESYSVAFKDIIYLESNQRLIYLYTVTQLREGDHFYGKMQDLASELEPIGFLRIQKSYLVNMEHIKKLNYDRVILSNGKELSVSQKWYSQIKIRYLGWKNNQWGR